jgi:hypothetical protein
VLLATGYAQWRSRVVDEDFTFIAKPYRREALAGAIRAAFARSMAAADTEKTVET